MKLRADTRTRYFGYATSLQYLCQYLPHCRNDLQYCRLIHERSRMNTYKFNLQLLQQKIVGNQLIIQHRMQTSYLAIGVNSGKMCRSSFVIGNEAQTHTNTYKHTNTCTQNIDSQTTAKKTDSQRNTIKQALHESCHNMDVKTVSQSLIPLLQ